MQLIRGLGNLPQNLHACALTIGNFDGVHLGHQAILRHLREKADELHLPMVVMLFEPQPREYFCGEDAPARLMHLRDKLHYLEQAGVDIVIVAKFDRTFAALPAQQFIEDWLVRKLKVKFLSIGDDFKFGAKRQGNFAMLQQAGEQFGFTVEDNRSFCLDELRISSTAIRLALANDDLPLAEKLLGHPYRILGRVIHGNELGRTIDFPTANIRLHRQVNPVKGVYAVKVRLKSGAFFNGVANIGTRPTINGVNQLLEAHLFDFQGDLYGQWLEVELCHKIRNEMKFPSFDTLKAQIAQDVETAKKVFEA
ncbi:bifunctional riboflavin kinase/FAD synthetase [Aggregatibacter actinomycetemcomitans]|uniref:bifunctional riboflavin kinase/FAD synthetase n=1 Tax=Aggregatibacter actinomycetemcomitans TaxID=714 RepID=UPI0011DA06EB|nr:bifunctional riboflavin kinase/FAD synthetase [Aggregatibacter actinomycetemcomitans]TYA29835.1 bifunctional riboflavin kinase/FAD synthetase [Aggregatibacter actinomycetemcomitans]TYA43719.1 bifunctional riboflavin kinase/FAD synthetase [Aggregatibacter actinomycetemcomitans]TYB04350.1 bifunctional riboflavin kinase/FAD synthetase [Aggregatibacter actinomycetemcomitans]TYB13219.1 bifunctional riboflavin kinase/FAD synthetase [Aggregatibacter actinomycetemcomitans]TYB18001.1 bifunctional ri